jgi:hypothetical protein
MGVGEETHIKEGDYITQRVKLTIKQTQINPAYIPSRGED